MKLSTSLRAFVALVFSLSASSAFAVSASWSPSSAQTGQTQTFSWSSSSDYCEMGAAIVTPSGSESVTAGSPGSYTKTVDCFMVDFSSGSPELVSVGSASATRTVTAPPQVPTVSASWSPSSREQNTGNQTFSWSSTHATSCNVGSGGASGSFSVSASSVGSFTQSVTCTGAGGSKTTSATRTVTAPPVPAPTVSASWSPSSRQINTGSQTFSWSSTHATSCNVGSGGASGSFSVSASSVGSFNQSVTCTGAGGSGSASATRTVTAAPPPPNVSVSASWSPSSRQVNSGNQTFSWNASNATSCNLGGTSGSFSVAASSVGSFSQSVTCYGAGNPDTDSATRTVTEAPPSQPVVTVPSTDADGNYTVTWNSVSGATSYDLRIDLPGGATSWQQIYSGSGTSKSESGRGEGTHGYIVRACNTGGCSGWSGRKDITVDATPAVPSLTAITINGNGDTVVNWSNVGASSYELRIYIDAPEFPEFDGWQSIYTGPNTSFTGPGLGGLDMSVKACNGNDCSNWSSSSTAPAVPTVTSSWSPATVTLGTPQTYTWSSTNATSCVNQAGTTRATSGSFPVTATSPTPSAGLVETLTCTGAGGSASSSATRYVNPPNSTISASWSSGIVGQSQTLTWDWSNASGDVECSLSEASAAGSLPTTSLTGASGTHSITASTTGSFSSTLNCVVFEFFDNQPEVIDEADITITRTVAALPSITASWSPNPVTTGNNSTLTWSATNATSCTIPSISGNQAVSDSHTYPITTSSNWNPTISCVGPGGTTTENVLLTVNPLPVPIVNASWSNTPRVVNTGTQTFSWTSTHAVSCDEGGLNDEIVVNADTVGTFSQSVTCTNASNVSTTVTKSRTVDPIPAPTVPNFTSITTDVNGDTVVNWNAVSGATSYELRVYIDVPELPELNGWQPLTPVVGTSFTGPSLAGLDLSVRACNGTGCSNWSSSTPAPVPLAIPTLGVTPSSSITVGNDYQLTWTAVVGQTYQLETNGVLAVGNVSSPLGQNDKPVGSYNYRLKSCYTTDPTNCVWSVTDAMIVNVTTVPVAGDMVKGDINAIGGTAAAPIIWGWACELGQTTPVSVTLSVGDVGNLTTVKTVLADLTSTTAIQTACGTSGAHSYEIPLTTAELEAHQGKEIHIHTPYHLFVDEGNVQIDEIVDFPLANSGTHVVPAPLLLAVPDIPAGLSAALPDANGDYQITWNAVTNVTIGRYELSIDDGTSIQTQSITGVGGNPPATSYDEITKSIGTYNYQVKACDASAPEVCSVLSTPAVEVEVVGPPKPTVIATLLTPLDASVVSNAPSFSWSIVGLGQTYNIAVSDAPRGNDDQYDHFWVNAGLTGTAADWSNSWVEKQRDANGVAQVIPGSSPESLTSGQTYYWHVVTIFPDGQTTKSSEFSFVVDVPVVMPIPELTLSITRYVPIIMESITTFLEMDESVEMNGYKASIGAGDFKLSWGSSAEAGSIYELSVDDAGTVSQLHSSSTVMEYNDTRTAGVYIYSLRVCNAVDPTNCGDSVSITLNVSQVTGVASVDGKLQWEPVTGALHYVVEQYINGVWQTLGQPTLTPEWPIANTNWAAGDQVRVSSCTAVNVCGVPFELTLTAELLTGVNSFPVIGTDPVNDSTTEPEYYGQLNGSHSVGQDGSFNYRILIEAVSGINGMQPNISLNYNSNRRNGAVGWGWSIGGLSAISRCPASLVRDGEVSGINTGDNYKFCLDGQRLVEVSSGEYRTEVESFSRIKRVGGTAAVPGYWTVERKDGSTYTYGDGNNSELVDGNNSTPNAMTWFINKQEDIAGNSMEFYYENTASGMHRIEHIEYTKNGSTNTNHRVEFEYATRDDKVVRYQAGALRNTDERLDKILVKANGTANTDIVRTYKLAYQVPGQTYNGKSYDDPVKTSRLYEVELCYNNSSSTCAEPLVFNWTAMEQSNFIYEPGVDPVDIALAEQILAGWGLEQYYATYILADFVGDDKLEYLAVHQNSVSWGGGNLGDSTVYYSDEFHLASDDLSSHTLITTAPIPYSDTATLGGQQNVLPSKVEPQVIDLNGDGKQDLILTDSTLKHGIQAYISNGSSLIHTSSYSVNSSEFNGVTQLFNTSINTSITIDYRYKVSFRDFNGDGLVDLLRTPLTSDDDSQITSGATDLSVALNSGSGFQPFEQWISTTNFPKSLKGTGVLIGDFNGDGLADLIARDGEVALNDGVSQVFNTASTFDQYYNDNIPTGVFNTVLLNLSKAASYRQVGDVNGDGLSDIVRVGLDGNVYVNLSEGDHFSAPVVWANMTGTGWGVIGVITTADGAPDISNLTLSDHNNDGMADLFYYTIDFGAGTNPVNRSGVLISKNSSFDAAINYLNHDDHFIIDYARTDHDRNGSIELGNVLVDSNFPASYTTLSSSFVTPRIMSVDSSQTININYEPLAQGQVYSSQANVGLSDNLNFSYAPIARSTPLGIYAEGVLVEELDLQSTSLASLHAVASLSITDGIGIHTESYHYHDAKQHRTGYGSLGFEKIERTTQASNQTQAIKTITERHQDVDDDADHDYRLTGQPKRQLTCVVDNSLDDCVEDESNADFNLLSDTRNQWKVRVYDDDQDSGFDSPHYMPYRYLSSTESWDLDGTKISDSRTQMTDTSFSCAPLSIDINTGEINTVLTTTSQIEDYSLYGVPLYNRTTVCSDPSVIHTQDVIASVTKNSNITNIITTDDWVPGLVGRVDTDTHVADSVGGLTAAIAKQTRSKSYNYYAFDSGNNQAGMLQSEIIEPDDLSGLLKHTSTYQYNAYGSVSNIAESWSGGSRSTGISETFASNGERTVTMTNPIGQTETTIYEARFGLPRRVTDINNLSVNTLYDDLGRVDTITYADGTTTESDYLSCTSCFGINSDFEHWYLQTKTTGSRAIRSYFDRLDREVGTRSYDLNGTVVYTAQSYDAQGNVSNSSDPYYTSADKDTTSYIYDLLNRSTQVTYADGSNSSTTYNGLTQTLTNQESQSQTRLHNGAGWVMRSTDNAGTPVDFTYTPWGDLKTTRVNNNSATDVTISYDDLGRKTQLIDPNTGTITYVYDAVGRLDYETDALNQKTDYDYDLLDRQIERIDDADATNPTARTHTWTYDTAPGKGKGQVASLNGFNTDGTTYSEIHEYEGNGIGLLSKTITTFGGNDYPVETIYDNFSRPVGSIYPTDYAISQHYNEHGYMYQIEDASNGQGLWVANDSDARGNLTQFTLGNGVITDQTYDDKLGRIKTIRAYKGAFELQDQEYHFDSLGNLEWRKDSRAGLPNSITEHFCYDTMNRLTRQNVGSDCGTIDNTTYDDLGNILTKQYVTGAYGYGSGSAGPNAVTSADGKTYGYDANGNLTTINGVNSVTYSPFNKPVTISKDGKSSTLVYNPNQDRIKRTDSNGRSSIYSALGLYEETTYQGTTEKIHYLSDFGLYIQPSVGDDYYLYQHRDHIGSIVAKSGETAADAGDLEWLTNEPWGNRLNDLTDNEDTAWNSALTGNDYVPLGTARGFTDHEHLDGVGLVHMNGRVYDPTLGRFMSPDPFVQAPYNTQSYNRYSYVFNNPLSFTDPSGYYCVTTGGGAEGSGVKCYQGSDDGSFDIGFFDTLFFRQQEEGRNLYDATVSFFTEGTIYQEETTVLNDFVGIFALTSEDLVADSATGVVTNVATRKAKKAKSFLDKIKDKLKKKGKCCFVAGTQVLTENGYKNIEDVLLGEKLWAKDVETGEQAWKPVTKIFVEPGRGIFTVNLSGTNGFSQKIEATDDHPFYVIGVGWKTTIELEPGDRIETDGNGYMEVASVVDQHRQDITYNFTVADFHTYYVTEQNILVHNCDENKLGLEKQLTNEQQVAELKTGGGRDITGPNADGQKPFRDADRAAADHGGDPSHFEKVKSATSTTSDGVKTQVHGIRNTQTGEVFELKTKRVDNETF